MVLVHELKRDIMLKIERQAEAFALSRAEKRVMVHLVRSGQTPAGIAALLGTSERTVRCQLSSIFRKTGTRNQQELIRMTLVG
jgi:DNA-binding CsgD family transcriptional regulator